MSRYVLSKPKPYLDVACFEGNFQSYVEDLRKRKGPDADQPHRIAYKKLVRA
jgi:energy-dependent translational throttle protein EttA